MDGARAAKDMSDMIVLTIAHLPASAPVERQLQIFVGRLVANQDVFRSEDFLTFVTSERLSLVRLRYLVLPLRDFGCQYSRIWLSTGLIPYRVVLYTSTGVI